MDKVMEKIEQHAVLCKMLVAEGHDVKLLPVVLGVLGHFSSALILQQKNWTFPMLEELHVASFKNTAYTVYKTLCPNHEIFNERQIQKQGEK
jgi:hypothetical protein